MEVRQLAVLEVQEHLTLLQEVQLLTLVVVAEVFIKVVVDLRVLVEQAEVEQVDQEEILDLMEQITLEVVEVVDQVIQLHNQEEQVVQVSLSQEHLQVQELDLQHVVHVHPLHLQMVLQ
jgi:hypothetical protein